MTVLEKISDAFLTVLSWFKTPKLIHPDLEDEYVEIPPPKEKPETTFPQTLSDLLDNIEATFDTYKLKLSPNSWLSRDECVGLRKLGAHVPQKVLQHTTSKLVVVDKKPSIFLVSSGAGHDENGSMKCLFGIKHKKLPWNVKKVTGTPYAFGMAHKYDKELFWIHGWIVITPDNEVVLCEELRYDPVRLPNGYGYMRKKMDIPELATGLQEGEFAKDLVVKMSFTAAFNWWVGRAERWSVAVLSKGERLTFSISKEDTKKYFANRDKSVKTESGHTKKIVHFVNEHERVANGKVSKVREHIRGLSVFDWSGYKCVVTAPEFHYAASIKFDIAPTLEGVDVEDVSTGYMGMSKVGHLLAQREDADSLRRHT